MKTCGTCTHVRRNYKKIYAYLLQYEVYTLHILYAYDTGTVGQVQNVVDGILILIFIDHACNIRTHISNLILYYCTVSRQYGVATVLCMHTFCYHTYITCTTLQLIYCFYSFITSSLQPCDLCILKMLSWQPHISYTHHSKFTVS